MNTLAAPENTARVDSFPLTASGEISKREPVLAFHEASLGPEPMPVA